MLLFYRGIAASKVKGKKIKTLILKFVLLASVLSGINNKRKSN